MKKVIVTLVLLCMHAYISPALNFKGSEVKFVSMTPANPEEDILDFAKKHVRNPNMLNDSMLIGNCMINPEFNAIVKHQSLTLEINTSRANALKIERDTTATYQEFSQRYANPTDLTTKNPKTRIDEMFVPLDLGVNEELQPKIEAMYIHTLAVYDELIKSGIALECARFVLPQTTRTRLYKKNSLLEWIEYFKKSIQGGKEQDLRDIEQQCQQIFTAKLPIIGTILAWQQRTARCTGAELDNLKFYLSKNPVQGNVTLANEPQSEHPDSPVILRHITSKAEQTIAEITRVSNPKGQYSTNYARLLTYCWEQGHVSPFEQANLSFQIDTSLAIAHQIQRHRSMQAWIDAPNSNNLHEPDALQKMFAPIELRSQDKKNRQNSIDNVSAEEQARLQSLITELQQHSFNLYKTMLESGVHPSSAANILPLNTRVNVQLTGNLRSFLTYINSRRDPKTGTQKEHQDVAAAIQEIMRNELPVIAESAGWMATPETKQNPPKQ